MSRASRERPDPTRLVADEDVLAVDLFVDGDARRALDLVRDGRFTLVASDPLLDATRAVVADLGDAALADDWRAAARSLAVRVDHPVGDHPALASARAGRAAHLLTYDERLLGPQAGASIKPHVETSVKEPAAFVRLASD